MVKATYSKLKHVLPLIIVALGCIFIDHLAQIGPVLAQETVGEVRVYQLLQEDVDANGEPDLTIIDCAFITSRDQVLIYDRGDDMIQASNWRQATDFENDLWVFDAAADGNADLIIQFDKTDDGLIAELWDDQDGDGMVLYQTQPNRSVLESAWPTVRVLAPDGWWLQDGKVNFNLELTADGPVRASFQAPVFLDAILLDGKPDFIIKVADLDGDGRPDWQWTDTLPDAPSSWGVNRSELIVNPKDDEYPLAGSIFWPYLASAIDARGSRGEREPSFTVTDLPGGQPATDYNKFYVTSLPPIKVAWQKAAIATVGEFVASRHNDSNWFLYSKHRIRPGETSVVNFEAPFAFYDLAADDDGYPELLARLVHWPANDQFMRDVQNNSEFQHVRYSWDQDNDQNWDYKVGLVGRHHVSETISIGDLTASTVPPEILPEWIMSREWDGATFAAHETAPTQLVSEGLKEWEISNEWYMQYLHGQTSSPPVGAYQEIEVGYRGEVSFDHHDQPYLYFSPVDRRLHLLKAQFGLWQLGEEQAIQLTNLGGDKVNQWTLVSRGQPVSSLFFASGLLIYAQDITGRLQVKIIDDPPALFTTLPPQDHGDWQDLNRQFLNHRGESIPYDLHSMAAQFGPADLEIEGIKVSGFRLQDNGFRFLMELHPGFGQKGAFGLDVTDFEPGRYVVAYDEDDGFSVGPAIPGALDMTIETPVGLELVAGEPVPLRVTTANAGTMDVNNLTLVTEVFNGVQRFILADETIDLLAGGSARIEINWLPEQPGPWLLRATLKDQQEEVISEASLPANVAASDTGRLSDNFAVLNIRGRWWLAGLLLLGGAVLIGVVVRYVWFGRSPGTE